MRLLRSAKLSQFFAVFGSRYGVTLLLLIVGGAWGFGLARLVTAKGILAQKLPRTRKHPHEPHNLASFRYGPKLRASSAMARFSGEHHPIFLVDERRNPHLSEKWCSAVGDPSPWVEVIWGEPKQVQKVNLQHAGSVEPKDWTVRSYQVRCIKKLSNGSRQPENEYEGMGLSESNNTKDWAEYTLSCSRAVGIRFDARPNPGDDTVRLFELEVWGQ